MRSDKTSGSTETIRGKRIRGNKFSENDTKLTQLSSESVVEFEVRRA